MLRQAARELWAVSYACESGMLRLGYVLANHAHREGDGHVWALVGRGGRQQVPPLPERGILGGSGVRAECPTGWTLSSELSFRFLPSL